MADGGFDRTSIPYDAMGDYSAFFAGQKEKEAKPCEGQDREQDKKQEG